MNADWAQVKRLFHGTLEQPPPERSAFLRSVCPHDPGLRAHVERLVAAHLEAGSFLEESPFATGAPQQRPRIEGAVIGHCRAGRVLGSGGMGEVYEGVDLELGRAVALKVVTTGAPDGQFRLRREAQRASRLNHPNICTIYEAGQWEGRAFIVMERITGVPLSSLIPPSGLPVETALRYGIEIASALAHAHEQRVVHGDLKSANVMVTTTGHAKVVDFGLARDMTDRLQPASGTHPLEGEGRIEGTLAYMAPELLRGEIPDTRSDVWAIGVLLSEMASGRRPHTGTAAQSGRPSIDEEGNSVPSGIPPVLETVIRRCLERDPRERYQQAADVCSALEEARDALRPGGVRLRHGMDRPWAAAALAMIPIAFVLVWASGGANRGGGSIAIGASGRPAIAVLMFENPGQSEDLDWLSHGLASLLRTGLAQTPGLDVVTLERLQDVGGRGGESRIERLQTDAAFDVARRAGAGAVVTGAFFDVGEEVRIDVRIADLDTRHIVTAGSVAGRDVFALADDLIALIRHALDLKGAAPETAITSITTESLEAYRLFSGGREALRHARGDDARDLLHRAIQLDPSFAMAYFYLTHTRERVGEAGANEVYRQKLLEQVERLPERLRLLVIANAKRRSHDREAHEEAARLYEELIARYPDDPEAYGQLSTLYLNHMSDRKRGLEAARRAVQAFPDRGGLRNDLGYALLAYGRYEEALAQFERYAALSPREPNPYDSAGEAYLMMGDPLNAIRKYRTAVTIDPGFTSQQGVAWALAMLGRYSEALAETRRLQQVLADRNVPVATYIAGEAFLLFRVGRHRDAVARLREAVDLAVQSDRTADVVLLQALSGLVALQRGEPTRALEHLDQAEDRLERARQGAPAWLSRQGPVLVSVLAGVAEARAGHLPRAQRRLRHVQSISRLDDLEEHWWRHLLEGEIHIAAGNIDAAERAFLTGWPREKLPYYRPFERGPFLQAFNDGLARVRKARGDLAGAVEIYRTLMTPAAANPWTAALAPGYVLELARLLERSGDRAGARAEYRRFLELWKEADSDLPELREARQAVVS